jgi:hypothetical protein
VKQREEMWNKIAVVVVTVIFTKSAPPAAEVLQRDM